MSTLKNKLYDFLHEQAEVFDFLQVHAPDGCWYYHASHPEKIWMNPRFKSCLGYTAEQDLSWNIIKNHEDAVLENFIARVLASPNGVEYRLLRQNGVHVWFRIMALSDNLDPEGLLIGFTAMRSAEAIGTAGSKNAIMNLLTEYEGDSIIITDTEGYVLWVNKGFEQLTGYTLTEMRGRKPKDLLQGKDTDISVSRQLGNAIRARKSIRAELVNYHKSGRAYWLEMHISPIFDDSGECTGFMSVGRDITRRKEQEEEAYFQTQLLEKVGQPVIATRPEGYVFYWNKKAEEVYGWKKEEVIGRSIMDIVPLTEISAEERSAIHRQNFGKLWVREFTAQRRNGEFFPVQITNQPIFNEKGEPIALIGISQDITERKQYEEALKKQAQLQNMLMRLSSRFINLPLMQLTTALDKALAEVGAFFNTDRAYIFEYSFEKNIAINTHEWCREGITSQKANLQEVPLNNIPEWVAAHLNGENVHITDTKQITNDYLRRLLLSQNIKSLLTIPMRNGDQCIGFVGFDAVEHLHTFDEDERRILLVFSELLVNVWLRRRMENELLRTKQLLEQTNKAARIGGWEVDLVANTVYWSEFTKAIHEVEPVYQPKLGFDELLQERINFYKEGYSKDRINEVIQKAIQDGTPFDEELQIVTAKGRELWVRVIGEAQMENGICKKIYGSFHDIDAAKKAELALIQKTEEFNELVALIPMGVYKYEDSHRFTYVSPGWCKLNNLQAEDVYANPDLPIGLIHPDDRERFIKTNEEVIRNKTDYQIEIRKLSDDDSEVRWMRIASRAKTDTKGHTVWFGTQTDITDEKQAALALAEAKEKAEAANKAKSEFLANMSHEIRTPLNGIIGFTDLLMHTSLNTLQQEYMESVYQSALSLQALISDILDFSKIEAGKLELYPETVIITDLIRQTAQTISYQVQTKGLELITDTDSRIPPLRADGAKLRQILINLLGNAIKFTEKGMISVKVKLTDIKDNRAILRFSVRDTGIGIAPAYQQKIFEAFVQADSYTNKRFGGTGLGLSISNKLLNLMGSSLQLESEAGRGSHFYFDVVLPLEIIPSPTLQAPVHHAFIPPLQQHSFSVLVVDDNPVNLLVARRIVQHLAPQAQIQEAASGKLAVELYSRALPDIVLMDLQMPEINGIEATGMIRALENNLHKHTPIIAVTAGTISGEREKCLAAGMDDFMPKPIDKDILRSMLEKWLLGKPESLAYDVSLSAEDDFHTLRQYRQNDKTFSREIEQMSRERFIHILRQIDESIQSRDLPQLQKSGHDLRGTALNLGLKKIAATSLTLEYLPEWQEEPVKQLQAQIHAQISEVIQWLDTPH